LRHKRRTVLSVAAIVLGIAFMIFGNAMVGGIEEGIVRAAEDGLTSHVLLRAKDYPTRGLQHPLDDLVVLPEPALELIRSEAEASTARTMFVGTAISGRDSLRIRCIGFDPSSDESVFRRQTWNLLGTVPARPEDGVLMGEGLASLLHLEPGSRFVLQARTKPGAINALELPVAGLLQSGNSAVDGIAVYLPDALARQIVATDSPTHVGIRLRERDEAEAFAARLRPLLGPGIEALTWVEDTRDLIRLQGIRRRAIGIFSSVLLIMSAFAIANTILMAAHERVREVGTLRALGMSQRHVLALFLLEGAIMGSAAGAVGASLGSWVAIQLARSPIDLAALGASRVVGGNLQFSTWLYASYEPRMVLLPLLISFLVAVLASAGPARVAAALQPADAVRAE
jgi:putative ABC transport system permease protein